VIDPLPLQDFVKIAARFNAVIVPFGAVGAADTASIALDASELAKAPFGLGERMRSGTDAVPAARRGMWKRGEEDYAAESFAFPLVVPNPRGPDRFYFKFGEPFDTADLDPKDSAAMDDAYAKVKASVEDSIAFCLTGREKDPFRAVAPRLLYEKVNGKQAPTFTLAAASDPKKAAEEGKADNAAAAGTAGSQIAAPDDDGPSLDAFTTAFAKGTSREV